MHEALALPLFLSERLDDPDGPQHLLHDGHRLALERLDPVPARAQPSLAGADQEEKRGRHDHGGGQREAKPSPLAAFHPVIVEHRFKARGIEREQHADMAAQVLGEIPTDEVVRIAEPLMGNPIGCEKYPRVFDAARRQHEGSSVHDDARASHGAGVDM